MARRKKHQLPDCWQSWEGSLFGLVSSAKDYLLCFALNETLKIDLVRLADVELVHPRRQGINVFSLFRYYDEENRLTYYLAANKGRTDYLVPEYKQTDFLLLLAGHVDQEMKTTLTKKLKELALIQLVTEIPYENLRFKDRLIFE